jgi:hypothetical protein
MSGRNFRSVPHDPEAEDQFRADLSDHVREFAAASETGNEVLLAKS